MAPYPGNVATRCPDVVYVKTDTANRLGNEGAVLQRLIDTVNAVIYRQDEAADLRRT